MWPSSPGAGLGEPGLDGGKIPDSVRSALSGTEPVVAPVTSTMIPQLPPGRWIVDHQIRSPSHACVDAVEA